MEVIDKINFFRKELNSLQCLKAMEFTETKMEYIPATALIPEGYFFWLDSPQNRSIKVKFFALTDKELVSIKVINTESEDSFELFHWLKKNNLFTSYDAFRLTSYNGEFPQRVDEFFNNLAVIFNLIQLAAILKGDVWESIPFDWAGMR